MHVNRESGEESGPFFFFVSNLLQQHVQFYAKQKTHISNVNLIPKEEKARYCNEKNRNMQFL